MAKTFTPLDGKVLMTALARQATGQQNITVTDFSSFVSTGETVLATGTENVLNALSILIFNTRVASRRYRRKLQRMEVIDQGAYSNRLRKISYYSKDPQSSGFFNTDEYTNLAAGFTNGQNPDANGDPQSLKSMWEQNPPIPLEVNFGGSVAWDMSITYYEDQLKIAFESPDSFARFVAGYVTEYNNDIETQMEAFNRITLLSRIGGAYYYTANQLITDGAINLTAEFNLKFGTSYTSAELRSTYLKDFLAFMVATVKKTSDFMTERSKARHLPMTKTIGGVQYSILRHTPKEMQHLYMYSPLFKDAEALVMPEIFNPQYLDINNYEDVTFWQSNASEDVRPQVKVKVPYYDATTGTQLTSSTISIPYVVGLLTDRDGMMVSYQVERAYTTPIEARKGYRNTWLHIAKLPIVDPTENAVLFYMEDAV